EAELIKWLVDAGDAVKESQSIAEMQTDKALVEVPSPWAGTITELVGKSGDIIKVGAVLVRYGATAGVKSAPVQKAAPAKLATSEADQGTVVGNMSGTLSVSDRFARRPEPDGSGVSMGKASATPAVRRIARELQVDIDRVQGTGRGGRVTAGDVESASSSSGLTSPAASADAVPLPVVDAQGVSARIPFRGVRRKIAEALSRSVRTCVHFTATDEADVTALESRRGEFSETAGRRVTLLPFVSAAVCQALRRHPSLNAIVDDDAGEILIKGVINLGFAVDTDAGLMVPVIRDADRKSPLELADGVKSLAQRCRDRTISREESLGGTFTISNVGSYGAMFATPIINYPEVAILAVGRAKEKVLVKDGRFFAGWSLPLSISCDHRVVDGAEAARFLHTLVQLLESP
ncbi:MAG: 2-oxo acid dehydrogenase subunit E2, partial [Phycisphaerales bacterium]|nr:2-oxo acid dehydrogenase subunit E2 [Phycisphaerales bacterium]